MDEPYPSKRTYYGGGQNWDDHPPKSYADAAQGPSQSRQSRDNRINLLEKKFDKFSSEITHILECVTNEFKIYKEKQKVIEMQHDILMMKLRRIEAEKYLKATPHAENFIKENAINDELLSNMKPKEEAVVRIAIENSHQCDLLKETQELNHALAKQQDSSNNIEALLNYVKDIFAFSRPPPTTFATTLDTDNATSVPEDSEMSSRRLQ